MPPKGYKPPSFFTLKRLRKQGSNNQNGGQAGESSSPEKKQWNCFFQENATSSRF